MACVYRHIRLDKNEPFYIGIGKTIKRAYSNKNRNKYWKNIVSKSGYEVDILFDDLSWDHACKKEIEFISLYGRNDLGNGPLVNMTNGGDGTLNIIVSEETKKKISQIHKGNKYRLGKNISEHHKNKISQSNRNRIWDEKSKEKLSIIFSGKKIWDKKPHPLLGKKLSEEHKNKMKIANMKIYAIGGDNIKSKRINQYTLDNQFIKTWGSSKCIERELNIDSSSVIKCCRGKLKTCKKFIFKYAD